MSKSIRLKKAMNKISSKDNPSLKKLKALAKNKGRKKYGQFLVEGPQVLEEIRTIKEPVEVYIKESYQGSLDTALKVTRVQDDLFDQIAPTVQSQGVLALYEIENKKLEKLSPGLVLYLDGISDPGNLGGLIRSAVSFNVSAILLSEDCVDIYNPKVVRSTMSALFKLPFYQLSHEALLALTSHQLLAADLSGQDLDDYVWEENSILILGNEAHGVSQDLRDRAKKLTIPMEKSMESLNVNVAGSICMYDCYIKRGGRKRND